MRLFCSAIAIVCLGSIASKAQQTSNSSEELTRVTTELQQTRLELAESQRQIEQLRQDLDALRSLVQAAAATPDDPPAPEPSAAAADTDVSFLAAKVAELHQDKIESASKYPVKISGLVLFNSYVNGGSVANADLPVLAFARGPGSPNGNIGATLSQTLLGIEAQGPKLFGARTSGNASIDFAGGYPTTSYGVTAGLIRLRTAGVHLDWEKTSVNIAQDSPFFSPLSPTSYATVKEPAFSWAGNLWVWTPQIEAERRVSLAADSTLVLQGGLLDPLTEEVPSFQGRTASAGELSRVPAIAGRIAWDRHSATRVPFTVGIAGYRARQRYEDFSQISSWTVNTDFVVSLTNYFELSGEWYRGQAVGGLGGGIWISVVYPDLAEPYTAIHPLRSTGGWAQLKAKPSARVEINAAFGQDENFGTDLRFFSPSFTDYGMAPFQKNRASFVNVIYKPRSSLLFAVEYRHLLTALANSPGATGDHVNLAAGVRF